jgi:hypothetical protein
MANKPKAMFLMKLIANQECGINLTVDSYSGKSTSSLDKADECHFYLFCFFYVFANWPTKQNRRAKCLRMTRRNINFMKHFCVT